MMSYQDFKKRAWQNNSKEVYDNITLAGVSVRGHKREETAMNIYRKKTGRILALLMAFLMAVTTALALDMSNVYAEDNTAAPSAAAATDEEVPEALQITVETNGPGLLVKWTAQRGAASYEIYRSYKQSSGWSLLKKGVTDCSYQDNAVASGKKAYYKVRARREDGSYSDYSDTASGIVYRVYIETGHGTGDNGKWDPGCTWSKYQEAKLMIPICMSMAKYLTDKGVYVYTDAFTGNNINLNVTLKRIKTYNVSVLVNVHCDYKKAPMGTMPLYRYSDQKKLAKCLNNGVHKYVKIKNRGLKKRTNLKTLNKTRGVCAACLFETGNIKKDNAILRTKYDDYGKGLAKGVCDYLGIKW